MRISLKNIELSKEENLCSFRNTLDAYIEKSNKLKKLYDSNCMSREYYEEIFSMYDISFDSDYKDVIDFMGSKNGIMFTTIPYCYNGSWMFLAYNIGYFELDLSHVYSKDEVSALVKSGKIVLLSQKPYISLSYKDSFVKEPKPDLELKTLEDYDFSNLDNNCSSINNLVIDMVASNFDYAKLEESIVKPYNLIEKMLHSYIVQASEAGCCEGISSYEEMMQIYEDKSKKRLKTK